MRLLHTSDWHLGQTLHNYDRSWEHQQFLDWLLAVLEAHEIDALLISGDIYDNANPSAATQRMFYRFLMDARQRVPHLNIVLIAGNHDSPGRLEAPAPFLESFDAYVVGSPQRGAEGNLRYEDLIVPLRDRHGETRAWCIAMPFLRVSDVPRVTTENDGYIEGITQAYAQAQAHALGLRQPGQAIIALGHCHMAGGQSSEHSERRVLIGGSEMLSSSLFSDHVAYVALGHLHLAQRVGGTEHIRYSGSPLPLSFAETGYKHQILKVELVGEGLNTVEPIHVPRAVPLLRIPEKHAPLAEVEAILSALELDPCEAHASPYLEVRVQLDGPEPALRARIESAISDKAVRLARIDTSTTRSEAATGTELKSLDDLGRLDPAQIFANAFTARFGSGPDDALLKAFTEIVSQPDEVTP